MKKLLLLCLCLLFVAGSAFGCTDQSDNTIKINEVTHSVFYAPQYLAMSLGYFTEEGLTIELTNGGGSDKSMTAILTGEADVALLGPETVCYVYAQGKRDLPVIFAQLTKRDGSFLVGRTPEKNFDYSNLAGKEIIMGRRGGMPAMTLQYILNRHGYEDGKNITMNYDVQFNLTAPAFSAGTGDYVSLFEPTASQLVRQQKGYIVSSVGKESGEVPYTCYVANKSYLKGHTKQMQKFLHGIRRATEYLAAHDVSEVADLLLPYFAGSTKQEIVDALANYKANDTWVSSPIMKPEAFSRLQEIMRNAGELQGDVPYEAVVDFSVAESIL